jgi:hypothetical protein
MGSLYGEEGYREGVSYYQRLGWREGGYLINSKKRATLHKKYNV